MADKYTVDDSTYYELAGELNVPAAAVRAVAEIESGGKGFLADGRAAILFEAHIFGKLTKYVYNSTHPNISSKVWNRSLYKGGAKEWDRLEEARSLNAEAANASASWGMFQICGFNHAACGYPSATAFADAMGESATNHVRAFARFIKSNPRMVQALRVQDWNTFTALYNGPGQVPVYSARLAQSYAKWAPLFIDQPPAEPIGLLSNDALAAQAAKEGPPIPPVDTSSPPPTVLSSKTVIAGGTVAATTGASVIGQVFDVFNNINDSSNSATGAINSVNGVNTALGGLLPAQWIPILLGLVALGIISFMVYRYIVKLRKGQIIAD